MSDNNGRAIATMNPAGIVEQVMIGGDLEPLKPADRVLYYAKVCQSLGLNPLTKPFEFIRLNNKLTLYALRNATDQIRGNQRVTVKVVAREKVDDIYVVTARATMPDGREDESIGAVSLAGLKGEALANAMMKAESKAKRRVTLSLVGLGLLDETEVETVAGVQRVTVDMQTGEIVEHAPPTPPAEPVRHKPVSHNDWLALVDACLGLGIPKPELPANITPSDLGKHYAQLRTKRRYFEKLRETESRAAALGVEIQPLPGTAHRDEIEERMKFLEQRIRLAEAAATEPPGEWDGDVPPEEEI